MSHNPSERLLHSIPLQPDAPTDPDAPPEGERWSTWDGATHGPVPRPDWVVTNLGAVDEDLGILKSGKEADVHLVRRWVPDGTTHPARDVTMAAKRYRPSERRMFHRDAGYLEGRRVRRSRETRAMARRTEFGREVIAVQWAGAEFGALGRLWELELPVPYPVQLSDTEMLMEFIGHDGVAAPRLAQARPEPDLLAELWDQLVDALETLAENGWAHGDLSAYNVLLDGERLVIIDWPQIVDVIGNPNGFDYLERDVTNVCSWFAARGLDVDRHALFGDLAARAAGA
ncbi:serine protein kinase RIO [Nostocoides japonicum]|uniref:serine protein kinase RIO n=1 Tax=Nostocoides japonicum TaxID=99481 RepID=UPI00065B9E59|nr:RIO1 family regulatory kinase/ATPase [Tetrasphaera japonica]